MSERGGVVGIGSGIGSIFGLMDVGSGLEDIGEVSSRFRIVEK